MESHDDGDCADHQHEIEELAAGWHAGDLQKRSLKRPQSALSRSSSGALAM